MITSDQGIVDDVGPVVPQLGSELLASDSRLAYQPALNGLRGIAVLLVMAYHLNYGWARGGYLGVDTFFVLSGYLITTILLREWAGDGRIRLSRFWGFRARRLLPALLVFVAVVSLAGALVSSPYARNSLRWDSIASLFYFANWRFVLSNQSYFDLFSSPSPFLHLWSLAIEMQFYVVWPIVMLAVLRLKRGIRWLVVISVLAAASSAVLMAMFYRPGDPSRSYYGLDTRIHTILIGCLLAMLLQYRGAAIAQIGRRALLLLGVGSFGFVVVAFISFSDRNPFYYHGGSVLFALAVATLIGTLVTREGPITRALSLKPLVWVGIISYGLYLWHWPLIVWFTPTRIGASGVVLGILIIGGTFAIATASFYLLERPVRILGRGKAMFSVALAGAVAVTALIAVVATSGQKQIPPYYADFSSRPAACPAVDRAPAPGAPSSTVGAQGNQPELYRVLIVGDSTACSLEPGLVSVGSPAGITFVDASVLGCGVVSDEVAPDYRFNVNLTALSVYCHDAVLRIESAELNRYRPPIVLWVSKWESNAIVVRQGTNSTTAPAGSRLWQSILLARMDRRLKLLTRYGARVVLTTQPAPALGPNVGGVAKVDAETAQLNNLLRRFAADHPGQVSIVDMDARVCPHGPRCPLLVDGIWLRPDGSHYSSQGAIWVAKWLVPQIPLATAN